MTLNSGSPAHRHHKRLTQLEAEHTPDAVSERLSQSSSQNYLRDFVYGGIDGAVTTFAVVAGTIGAELSTNIILILGAANLFADGFSMAASNFLGTRAEHEDYDRLRRVEEEHIESVPEGEREEVRQIFAAKGFSGDDLLRIVEHITSDRDRWVKTMLTEEYGLPLEVRSEWKAAASTFIAFLICGVVPLVPFILIGREAFALSTAATVVVFFLIGSGKARWSPKPWWWSGMETMAIGGIAAGLAYAVGVLLKSIGAG